MKPEIITAATLTELSHQIVKKIYSIAAQAVEKRKFFSIALSGGNTPRLLHETLSNSKIPWHTTHIFWGDERWVPQDHPDSNFGMAFETLLSKIDIPEQNIHPIPTEMPNLEAGAIAYEQTLYNFFNKFDCENQPGRTIRELLPAFDLIILGISGDGHIASLFPGTMALEANNKLVVSVPSAGASPALPRLTLTLPVINNARNIFFLLAGAKKQKIMHRILDNPSSAGKIFPAALVQAKVKTSWFYADR